MQTITPFLWFDNNAEEAMNFYCSIFKDAKPGHLTKNGELVQYVEFELNGQKFMALNGGPYFKFTEAVSFFVSVDTQEEVDNYWEKLTAGGAESQCGWLKDKFGLSWQIIPKRLHELLGDKDQQKSARVMQAMLKMKKIDINGLEAAYNAK